MKKLKNLTLVVALALTPFVVNAQNTSDDPNGFRAYYFGQLQGGLHIPFTSGSLSDLVQPNFGLNIGRWFAPGLGARFGAEGFKSTAFYDDTNKYEKFNYLNFNIDGLFNLSPLFVKGNNPKLNFYLLAGVGLNYLTDKGNIRRNTQSSFSHNLRLGLGLEYRILKPLTLSLEYRVNNTADYYNGREKGSDDWFSSLLFGVSYNFGHSKKVWGDRRVAKKVPTTLSEEKDLAVTERMNTWMKRMKGESKADYLARTTDEAIETQRLAFGREYATDAAMTRSMGITASGAQYNAGTQALMIASESMPSIILTVPIAEAASLDLKNLRFENTKYDITADNQFEVIYTEAIDVKTGQKYIYNKANAGPATDAEGFISLADYQLKEQEAKLMASNNSNLTAQAEPQTIEEKTYNLKNTTVTRETQKSANDKGTNDYTVSYKYTVKDEFSVKDDFPVGQYEAEKSPASKAMLNLIAKQMSSDFAKHFEAGKSVEIRYRGMADAKQINGSLKYNGVYGDAIDKTVTINGKQQKLSVTKAEGITTNEQLSLLRAISVQKFINKNVSPLKNMNVKETYNLEVSPNEGGQYRRVSVDFIFHDTTF